MHRFLIGLSALLVVAVALGLWQTRYSYLPIPTASPFQGVGYVMRVNRYTGRVQIFVPGGDWLDLGAGAPHDAAKR